MRLVRNFLGKHKFVPNPVLLIGSAVFAGRALAGTGLPPDTYIWTALGIGFTTMCVFGWEARPKN